MKKVYSCYTMGGGNEKTKQPHAFSDIIYRYNLNFANHYWSDKLHQHSLLFK